MATRNLELEKQSIANFAKQGRLPQTSADWAEIHRMAYGNDMPDEFKNETTQGIQSAQSAASNSTGLTPQGGYDYTGALTAAKKEMESKQGQAGQYQNPSGALSTFQQALGTISNAKAAPLGESLVFGQAGVTGYGALAASLGSRTQELQANKASYERIIEGMTGAYSDTAKALASQYDDSINSYNKAVENLIEHEKLILNQQNALDLLKVKDAYDKAGLELQARLKDEYGTESKPTSYQEWSLAGGEDGTGKSYAKWLTETKSSKPPTQAEYSNAGYAMRTIDADKIINNLTPQYTSAGGLSQTVQGKLPGLLQKDWYKQLEQAERNFVNAVLRRESGAAISPSEFDSAAKQYFPQPGDSEMVLKQKEANRKRTMQGIAKASGSAIDESALEGLDIQPSTGGYDSLEDYVQKNPDKIDLVNQLDKSYPNATDEEILDMLGENDLSYNGDIKNKVIAFAPQGSKGGQCTTFLHKIADFPSIGDTKNEKFSYVDTNGIPKSDWTPVVGDIIVTNEDPKLGHTAIITSINPDGTATLSESNYYQKTLGKEKVSHTRKIALNSNKIYGAIRPTNLKV